VQHPDRGELHFKLDFGDSIRRRFSENSSDAEFLAFVRRDPLQPHLLPCRWIGALMRWIPPIEAAAPSPHPALLVQGRADRTLNCPHNLKVLKEKLPNTQRLLLGDAKHHLVNESASLRQPCWDFLARHLQPHACAMRYGKSA